VMNPADANMAEAQVVAHLQMHLGSGTAVAHLEDLHWPLCAVLLRRQGVGACLAELQCLSEESDSGVAARDDQPDAMKAANLLLGRYRAARPGRAAGNVRLLARGRGNQLETLALEVAERQCGASGALVDRSIRHAQVPEPLRPPIEC